jgi:hypothetical protein
MLGDYPLQGEFLANFKGKYDYLLFCHVVIWTGCICVGLWFLGLLLWWKVVMLLVGHFLIDRRKARKTDKTNALTKDLWIDQLLHLAQLISCLI